MFDEYVEHSVPVPSGIPQVSSLPQLQYEGFEPVGENSDLLTDVEASQQGLLDSATISAPIFDLGRVQCAINAPLVSLVVCSDILVMGLSSNTLIIIELAHSATVTRISIPNPNTRREMNLYKVFMDPSGRHIIITTVQGDNFYFFRLWKKPKQLKSQGLGKIVIESVAWNQAALLSNSRPTSTREILIGASNGVIYQAVLDAEDDFFKPLERNSQQVFNLPERHPITGIKFNFFPPSAPKKALVVVTTPSRIYQFLGVPERRADDGGYYDFQSLFGSYKDTVPRILELPGDMKHSELHYYTPNPDQALSLPKSLAWMTAPGIYHGNLNFESTSDDYIDMADVLPYPFLSSSSGSNASDTPLSIALTEFHYIVVYSDRITAICHLDDKLTYEEPLPLKPNEQVMGLTADPVRKTYWVFTDQSLFELLVGNEDRDVWMIYLEKGEFDVSLRYAKTAAQRNKILAAQASAFFDEGRFFQAAQCYSQCSVTFEEVALKFLDAGERDALRAYMISRLERTRKTDRTQRMMLATWLVEFYLSKCNGLDDVIASESVLHDVNNLETERTILQDDLRHFFETYKANLESKTVYELIQGHGRTDMYLHFATVIGDHDRVIEHWIMEEEWSNAITVINRQTDLELYYRFASVLMRNAAKDTVDSWLKQPSLDPHRLIPALLQQQHAPRDPVNPNQAIRFLNHVVFEQQNTSSTIHNLLITFYASPTSSSVAGDDAPLLRFLSTAPSDPLTGKPYYDLDYALRICKQSRRTQPCVHIYAKMGLWENSVDLALEKGDLELAKINADMPEDDQSLRKKLWLKIARYVVQDKKDIKTAMQFLENTDLLKIEDILSFFPDFVVIDDFKEEIAQALEGYSAHIESLKTEMDEATRTAESIKQDMVALTKRFVTIDAGEQCSSCSHLLLTRQFYVFPCRHTFHADCLIGLAKEYLPAHSLRRMLTLQNELVKGSPVALNNSQPRTQRTLLSANFNPINPTRAANMLGRNLLSAGDRLRDLIVPDALAAVVSAPAWIPGIGGGRRNGNEIDGGKRTERLRAELEDLLASSCPLCESVVVGLDKPFVKEGSEDTTWAL
ncbi:Pep3/Vps18/deep orange family-domain-containing protein [Mycena floridula]|nr:Pep3/Vps18/deep orange family-domain-containing protein [Mycena floridula]